MKWTKSVPVMNWEIKKIDAYNEKTSDTYSKIKDSEVKNFIDHSKEGDSLDLLTPVYEHMYLVCSARMYLSEEGYFDEPISGSEIVPNALIISKIMNCGDGSFVITTNDYKRLRDEYTFLLKGDRLVMYT